MLTLLTATGCRPEAWAICEKLMQAQTFTGSVRWIIVDDGEEAQPITFAREGWQLEVVRREPFWKPGQNTQALNLWAGLARVNPYDRVAIIEDDDHYSSDWLATINAALGRADLVGENMARYYNVATHTGRQLQNTSHASLCSTGVKGMALEMLRRECKPGVQFIDMNLWRNFKGAKHLFSGGRVTGIKGMPGRGGIGMGHKHDFHGIKDEDGELLREWIGRDAGFYMELTCS